MLHYFGILTPPDPAPHLAQTPAFGGLPATDPVHRSRFDRLEPADALFADGALRERDDDLAGADAMRFAALVIPPYV